MIVVLSKLFYGYFIDKSKNLIDKAQKLGLIKNTIYQSYECFPTEILSFICFYDLWKLLVTNYDMIWKKTRMGTYGSINCYINSLYKRVPDD